MDGSCRANPALCNASVVVLNYCDGNSFAGARTGVVEVKPPMASSSLPPIDNSNGNAKQYYCTTGALVAGHDIDVGNFSTVAAAEAHCNANSSCTAFTYRAPNSTAPAGTPLKVYFKSSLASNGDSDWRLCWQTKKANIRLRGRANLDAALETLAQEYGLDAATEVLLTGSSAGGLAAFLHADYVHSVLKTKSPQLTKYKVLPDSGYFVDHATTFGEPVIEDQFKSIFKLSNATTTVPASCLATQKVGDEWKCNFAQYVYETIASPIMIVQSTLDLWQTGCIMTSGYSQYYCDNCSLPVWRGCMPFWKGTFTSPFNCTHQQMSQVRAFQSDVQNAVTSVTTASKPGNGVFLHACHDHCIVFSTDKWSNHIVNGVAASDAVASWWASSPASPAKEHTHVDACLRNWNGTSCNPSCGATAVANTLPAVGEQQRMAIYDPFLRFP